MTADDDDIDDASLKSMRAVWLSMRDEEPPSAGMSALLAAAREQAEQMRAKPAWWERVFALLRKPPALAFATVLILIGGAVLVTRTSGDQQVESLTAAEPATPTAPRDEVQTEAQTEPLATPAAPAEPAPEPPPVTGKDEAGPAGDATVAKPPEERKPRPRDRKRAHTVKAQSYAEEARALEDDDRAPRAEKSMDGKGGAAGTTLDAPGRVTRPPPARPAPPPPPPAPAPAPASERAEDSVTLSTRGAERPTTPPVEQLARQAESAASRGDCAAVRVIAARIKKQDARFYAARIAKQPAIAKCL